MKIILVAPNPIMCSAWNKYFGEYEDVEIICDKFQNLKDVDCMTSAANSFGLMDGGIDYDLSVYFGWDLQKKVQQRIIEEYCGEQPVGTSLIVETGHKKIPYLAHTPTMRVPTIIKNTDNVYKAMWGLMVELHNFNKKSEKNIQSVAICAFGAGVGKMPYDEVARQMHAAYKHYQNIPSFISWEHAFKTQTDLMMYLG